jgi:ferredoxin-type protein NapF
MSNLVEDSSKRALFSRLRKTATKASQLEKTKLRTPRALPRPPHAVDETLFLELCNGCNACVEVCPTQVIALQESKAYLDLDLNHCTLCGDCADICDTHSLSKTQLRHIDARPTISPTCNNYLSSPCRACSSSCPENAITIVKNEMPSVDSQRCIGCGLCRGACYIGAITMDLHNPNSKM